MLAAKPFKLIVGSLMGMIVQCSFAVVEAHADMDVRAGSS